MEIFHCHKSAHVVSVLLCVDKLYLKLECEMKKWSFPFYAAIRNDQKYFVALPEFILQRRTVTCHYPI